MAAERIHTFLVLKRGGRAERIVVWDTQDISVGRAPENDVTLDDSEMSRQHAVFHKSDAGYAVRNMSLSNPTFVNDQEVETQPLKNKDVVKIAESEFIFYRVAKNPVTLGMTVEYASQLKSFEGPQMQAGDGEATILGLVDTVQSGDDEEFVVRPAGDFEHDLHGVEAPRTRNLDAELADDGLDDLDMPTQAQKGGAMEAWTLEETPASDTVSLQLEIQGLTGPQQASLRALLGKVIELPKLRIRFKGDDLA